MTVKDHKMDKQRESLEEITRVMLFVGVAAAPSPHESRLGSLSCLHITYMHICNRRIEGFGSFSMS